MKKSHSLKIAIAGIMCAVAVAGSFVSFPVFGSKCAPVQHMVNILSGVLLGPWYALAIAIISSTIRNLTGLGTLMAFPGSMFGAFLCGLVFRKTKFISLTLIAEIFGTAVIGGLCAYPVAILLMGQSAGSVAFYGYIFPFFVSTFVGSIIAGIVVFALKKTGVLDSFNQRLTQ